MGNNLSDPCLDCYIQNKASVKRTHVHELAITKSLLSFRVSISSYVWRGRRSWGVCLKAVRIPSRYTILSKHLQELNPRKSFSNSSELVVDIVCVWQCGNDVMLLCIQWEDIMMKLINRGWDTTKQRACIIIDQQNRKMNKYWLRHKFERKVQIYTIFPFKIMREKRCSVAHIF